MALFDRLQRVLWGTVHKIMGDDATWQPAQGGVPLSAKILFNEPTEAEQLQVEYQPAMWSMEYHLGQFPGLYEAVRSGSSNERVTIAQRLFVVRSVELKYDGKTYLAHLENIA